MKFKEETINKWILPLDMLSNTIIGKYELRSKRNSVNILYEITNCLKKWTFGEWSWQDKITKKNN